MSDTTVSSPRRGGGFRWALAWLAILGLVSLVTWLASERNARTWYLVPADGRLVVMKGYLLPTGRGAFETADPAVAQAYAPLVPPPGKPTPPSRARRPRCTAWRARRLRRPRRRPPPRIRRPGRPGQADSHR